MTNAEHAVHEAATSIPAEVCARFESADKLSDEDRKAIIEIARHALVLSNPNRRPNRKPKTGQRLNLSRMREPSPQPKPSPNPRPSPSLTTVQTARPNGRQPNPQPETEPKPEAALKKKP